MNFLQLQTGEKVTAMFPVDQDAEGGYLVMATRQGVIKKTPMSEFANIRKGGIIAQQLRDGDELIAVEYSDGNDEFIVASKKGKSIRFREDDVRAMGRVAAGVRAILLDEDDAVVDMVKVIPGAHVLTVSSLGMGKRTKEANYPLQRRGGKGVLAMSITERTGDLECLRMATEDEDLMLIRDDGTLIRMPLEQVSVIGRNTQGVHLMRVDEGTRIASVAVVPHQEPEEDADGNAPAQATAEAPEGVPEGAPEA